MKLEAKIETILKKHPNKTMLVQLLQNNAHTGCSVAKISDYSDHSYGYVHKYAPSDTYWVISIWAAGPKGFGREYTVFFDRKGKFLTYHSYELVSPGLDF